MRKYFAEFIGTFVLTFVACGAAAFSGGIGGYLGVLGIAFGFGLSLVAMAYSIGNISGCHINPAVSLAMFISKRMSAIDFAGYVVAQMLGGIAAAFGLKVITLTFDSELISYYSTNYGINFAGLGTNGYGDASAVGINMWGAFIVEIILTCVFVIAVLGVTSKIEYSKVAGLVIGLTLTLVHIIGIPLTGTSVNPARSFGPALVTCIFGDAVPLSQEWVFIIGPLAGGLLAALIWALLNYTKKQPDEEA